MVSTKTLGRFGFFLFSLVKEGAGAVRGAGEAEGSILLKIPGGRGSPGRGPRREEGVCSELWIWGGGGVIFFFSGAETLLQKELLPLARYGWVKNTLQRGIAAIVPWGAALGMREVGVLN